MACEKEAHSSRTFVWWRRWHSTLPATKEADQSSGRWPLQWRLRFWHWSQGQPSQGQGNTKETKGWNSVQRSHPAPECYLTRIIWQNWQGSYIHKQGVMESARQCHGYPSKWLQFWCGRGRRWTFTRAGTKTNKHCAVSERSETVLGHKTSAFLWAKARWHRSSQRCRHSLLCWWETQVFCAGWHFLRPRWLSFEKAKTPSQARANVQNRDISRNPMERQHSGPFSHSQHIKVEECWKDRHINFVRSVSWSNEQQHTARRRCWLFRRAGPVDKATAEAQGASQENWPAASRNYRRLSSVVRVWSFGEEATEREKHWADGRQRIGRKGGRGV